MGFEKKLGTPQTAEEINRNLAEQSAQQILKKSNASFTGNLPKYNQKVLYTPEQTIKLYRDFVNLAIASGAKIHDINTSKESPSVGFNHITKNGVCNIFRISLLRKQLTISEAALILGSIALNTENNFNIIPKRTQEAAYKNQMESIIKNNKKRDIQSVFNSEPIKKAISNENQAFGERDIEDIMKSKTINFNNYTPYMREIPTTPRKAKPVTVG